MRPRFMLDTDMCSYIMKRSLPLVLTRLQSMPVDNVCRSVISRPEAAGAMIGANDLFIAAHARALAVTW